MITSFRRTNADFDYFAAGFRKYATVPDAAKATDDDAQADLAEALARHQGVAERRRLPREYFKGAASRLSQAGAVKGEPNLDRVIDTRFVEQALQELG